MKYYLILKDYFSGQNRTLGLALLALIMISALNHCRSSSSGTEANSESESVIEADTLIPDGFSLVPLELSNFESLNSVMGAFAIVDLYSPKSALEPKGKKLVSGVRLIRAPLNPEKLAALVPEEMTLALMDSQGPLFAAIQKRDKEVKTKLHQLKKSQSIVYHKEQ